MPTTMAGIDEVSEIVRRAKAAGHAEIAGGLITPGFIQRMLADRHQLDMRETHLLHIGHETVGQFTEVVETSVPVPLPGTGMHLVHVQWLVHPVASHTLFLPRRIAPLISIQLYHSGCRTGTHLKAQTVWIGLGEHLPGMAIAYLEFVELAQTRCPARKVPTHRYCPAHA